MWLQYLACTQCIEIIRWIWVLACFTAVFAWITVTSTLKLIESSVGYIVAMRRPHFVRHTCDKSHLNCVKLKLKGLLQKQRKCSQHTPLYQFCHPTVAKIVLELVTVG